MRVKKSVMGFEECADLISDQKYGYALQSFKQAVGRLVESKSFPKRSEVARQLLEVATALEETLKKLMAMDGTRTFLDLLKRPNHLPVPFAAKSNTK